LIYSQREGGIQLEIARGLSVVSDGFNEFANSLVGSSEPMQIVRALIAKFATASSTVLITGESGTGKQLCARAIHEMSSRRGQAFVPFNCSAVTAELLASQLFGHVRGAFPGSWTHLASLRV
jgi:two-component system, repressor protein LuxO